MNIVAIAGSTVPSDTANSVQVMKACQALTQLEHRVTLLVPGRRISSVDLAAHYGLRTPFPIEWLSSSSRRLFTWNAVRRARSLEADLIYTWFPQSAVFGLLNREARRFRGSHSTQPGGSGPPVGIGALPRRPAPGP